MEDQEQGLEVEVRNPFGLLADPTEALQAAQRLYVTLRAGHHSNGWRGESVSLRDVRPGRLLDRAEAAEQEASLR